MRSFTISNSLDQKPRQIGRNGVWRVDCERGRTTADGGDPGGGVRSRGGRVRLIVRRDDRARHELPWRYHPGTEDGIWPGSTIAWVAHFSSAAAANTCICSLAGRTRRVPMDARSPRSAASPFRQCEGARVSGGGGRSAAGRGSGSRAIHAAVSWPTAKFWRTGSFPDGPAARVDPVRRHLSTAARRDACH